MPQWRFPRATRDQCTVVTRDPQLGPQVGDGGGLDLDDDFDGDGGDFDGDGDGGDGGNDM